MSLRVVSRNVASRGAIGEAGNGGDSYIPRLVKLIPAEAVTAYPPLASTAKSLGTNSGAAILFLSWFFLIVVIVLRWHFTKSAEGRTQWLAVVISAVSFIIWVYAVNGAADSFGFSGLLDRISYVQQASADMKQFVATVAMFAWVIVMPAIYTGDSA
jgi:hypothetical protein